MKKVRDNSSVPQGGAFIYVNPEDGVKLRFHSLMLLRAKAKNHRIINHQPIGQEWDDQFEENVCANTPGQTCIDWTPPSFFEKLTSAGKALYKFSQTGFSVVTAEELERRRSICSGCNFYGGSTSLIKVACRKCGCSGLKLGLASSVCPIQKW